MIDFMVIGISCSHLCYKSTVGCKLCAIDYSRRSTVEVVGK